ncbi:MAG TPA: adenine deaminase C-terminal domain-containing protein, partial [Microvirga sp.]|nr:adenine deaminase C-terminal domain-containing protein [Microvirga sp.]
VLLDDDLKVQNTWYGGELVVENARITPVLDRALSSRYRYPDEAYRTVHVPNVPKLVPDLPEAACTANVIRVALPGIVLFHDKVRLDKAESWDALLSANDLTFVTVIERHGRNGGVAHGLLKDFGLRSGAVASSVGHDSHNLIVAGANEADMRLALDTIIASQGGVCVVNGGRVEAMVPLPIAGLLSDKRVTEVAAETRALKEAWERAGCKIPYMGFNLIPLSVIPEIRITDKGLVLVPEMTLAPLYEG